MRPISARCLAFLGAFALLLPWRPNVAEAQDAGARIAASGARHPREVPVRAKLNAWTLGLAGGLLEGAPIRFAVEMARVADSGDDLHVLPIVTRGPTENVEALLYLRGVDAAIINADVLEHFKPHVPNIQNRITSIVSLFPSEVHVLVRPEIDSLEALAGKKVNFNTAGTAAAYSGPLIFERLGLKVEKTFIPHQTALDQMRKGGDMAAVVFVTSKPVEAFVRARWEPGFKLLPVPYDARFQDYYLPATLTAAEYPGLIAVDSEVKTISVPTLLAAYNWPRTSDRYVRLDRFVRTLFDRVDRLQAAGFHPRWKDVDLSTDVPGLARAGPAQAWLDRADARETRAPTTAGTAKDARPPPRPTGITTSASPSRDPAVADRAKAPRP